MASADTCAIVTVKILIEKDEVAPVWIALKKFRSACHGSAAAPITEENVNKPPGNLGRYLPEIGFRAGVRGALHFEILTIVVMKFLKRFDE